MIWLGLLCKKLIKIAKNIFHYGRRWYKIRLIPGEMETLKRNQGAEKGEKGRGKTKKAGLLTKIVVLALLIYLATSLLNLQGQIASAQAERDDLSRQVAAQTQANADLADDVENSGDPERIQDIARDRLGLAAPDERIFIASN